MRRIVLPVISIKVCQFRGIMERNLLVKSMEFGKKDTMKTINVEDESIDIAIDIESN
ncbi:hypothetical protein GCM10008934_18530 [Virgibacillus salarius]|uniref:hypothetical protein n=1 Tax=Virgibacillus salarius TaxID=447199 RepID=UPI0031D1E2CC